MAVEAVELRLRERDAIASFVPRKPFTSETPILRLGTQLATTR